MREAGDLGDRRPPFVGERGSYNPIVPVTPLDVPRNNVGM